MWHSGKDWQILDFKKVFPLFLHQKREHGAEQTTELLNSHPPCHCILPWIAPVWINVVSWL